MPAPLPKALECRRVEITGVGSNQFPVSVANFRRDGVIPQPVDELLNAVPEEENGMDRDSDGVSDVSETSSSNEDCEDEGDGGGKEPPQNQGSLEAFLVFWRRPIREV